MLALEMQLYALLHLYIIGAVLYALVHLLGGSFTSMSTVTVRWLNNRRFRVWGGVPALILTALWPIVLPLQLYQNRR